MRQTVRTRFARGLMMDMNYSFSLIDSDDDTHSWWDASVRMPGHRDVASRSPRGHTSKGGATPTGSPGPEAPVATGPMEGGRSPLAGDPTPTHEAPQIANGRARRKGGKCLSCSHLREGSHRVNRSVASESGSQHYSQHGRHRSAEVLAIGAKKSDYGHHRTPVARLQGRPPRECG